MTQAYSATHLDILAFARAGAGTNGKTLLSTCSRLLDEADGDGTDRSIAWQAQGELRVDVGGHEQVWLQLEVDLAMPMVCQRCLGPVDMPVAVRRAFRFVATEAQAEEQDEDSEEDVLCWSRDFNLLDLMEDELLMELPVVPRHEVCPTEIALTAQDADFDDAPGSKPNPFAVLSTLQGRKSS